MSTPEENALDKSAFYSKGNYNVRKIKGMNYEQAREHMRKNSAKSVSNYPKTNTTNVTTKPKTQDWAGDVGRAHMRNQKATSKHYTEKGYREDYK